MMALGALLVVLSAKPQPGQTLASANEVVTVLVRAGNKVGSGVIVQMNPLTIATCFHVIQREGVVGVEVPFLDRSFQVTHAAVWPREDFAFLRVTGTPYSHYEPFSFRRTIIDESIRVVGFSHKNRKHPTSSAELRVADPVVKISELAAKYNMKLTNNFEVVDLVHGPFRRGDSGGPVFDAEGRLVGLAAGRFQPEGSDDVANFAIRPSHEVPLDDQFRPVATVVDDDGAYGTSSVLRQTLVLALTLEPTPTTSGLRAGVDGGPEYDRDGVADVSDDTQDIVAGNADGGVATAFMDAGTSPSCAELIDDALTQLRRTPPTELGPDAGVSGRCRAQYAKVREVEIALRTEQAAVESLRSFASRVEDLEEVVGSNYLRQLDTVIEEKKLEKRPARGTYTEICKGMQELAYDELGSPKKQCSAGPNFQSLGSGTWKTADRRTKEKAAAELVKRGDYPNDASLTESLVPPPAWTFTPHEVTGVNPQFDGLKQDVEQARRTAAEQTQKALGTPRPLSAQQIAPVVGAKAIDSQLPDSSESLRKAADERAKAVDALARLREALVREAQGLQ
ncbi:S1 family peptidase [Corallococcus interemptor]|uniref:S1 family peptidase n=1 Tax=Corallococcus interemptor TaxID=2316720 RepID=UPI003D01C0A2